MRSIQELIARKTREYGAKFDASDLAEQFKPYYENGQRIEVQFGFGETKRGRVGITTGWKPVFILMLTTRSMGSSWTLGKDDKVVRVICR